MFSGVPSREAGFVRGGGGQDAYIGNGVHANARKAMSVHAQLTPRLANMGLTNKGNLGFLVLILMPSLCKQINLPYTK